MKKWLERVSLLVCASLWIGCSNKGSPPDAGVTDPYPHEPLGLHCLQRLPTTEISPLGEADEDTFYGSVSYSNGANISIGFITHDRGRTGQVVPVVTDFYGEPHYKVLRASQNTVAVDASFWAVYDLTGSVGQKNHNDANFNPLWLTLVLDGRGAEVEPQTSTVSLPDGTRALRVWKGDAKRWMALSVPWLWATRDGGATWKRLGPVPFWNPSARSRLRTLGASGERVLFQEGFDPATPGDFFLQKGGGPLEKLPPLPSFKQWQGSLMRWWGERLVYMNASEAWVSDDLGVSWQPLTTLEPTRGQLGDLLGAQLDAQVDSEGNLYVLPVTPPENFPRHVYRYAPGSTTPTVLDPDPEGPPLAHFTRPSALPGGRMRMAVITAPTQPGAPPRDVYLGMACEFGPGTPALQELTGVESLEAAATSERVVRVARFKELSGLGHRLAISPSGRMYTLLQGGIAALPLDAPRMYDQAARPGAPNYGNVPETGSFTARALLGATDWGVDAYLYNPSTSVTPPPSLRVGLDTRAPRRLSTTSVGKNLEIFGADTVLGRTFVHTAQDTFFDGHFLFDPLTQKDPPIFPNAMVVNGPYGALVDTLQRDIFPEDTERGFVVRFLPWKERVPSGAQCHPPALADGSLPALPDTCVPTPPMGATAAQLDLEGNLYVADGREGRVLMLPAGKSTLADWVVLARGFLTPTDLVLRRVRGKQLVLVHDGDVFAFSVDPSRVKWRGAEEPPPRLDRAVFAARDLHDCLADGPCLEDASDKPLNLGDGSPEVCVTGRGLGAGAGRVFAESVEGQVTQWSDTRACFHFPGAPLEDGRLRVLRADGVASNLLPYEADGAITQWEVPDPVYPESLIRARGHNLGHPSAATPQFESDTWLGWTQQPGAVSLNVKKGTRTLGTRSIIVKPRLDHGCATARENGCTVHGAGFGGTSATGSVDFTASVGGQSAKILEWGPSSITFAWPPGLVPGVYPMRLSHPDGWTVEGRVELLPDGRAPQVLVRGAPANTAYSYAQQRPQVLSAGLLMAPMMAWQQEAVSSMDTPGEAIPVIVQPERWSVPVPRPGQMPERYTDSYAYRLVAGRPVHVLEVGDSRLVAGTAYGLDPVVSLATVQRRRPYPAPEGGTEGSSVTKVDVGLGAQGVVVADLGLVGGTPLLALEGDITGTTAVLPLTLNADGSLLAGTPVTVGEAFGWKPASREPVSQGAWLTPAGIYLSNCHNPTRPGAVVRFVPLSLGSDGKVQAGASQSVMEETSGALLACNTTADGGFIWVRREPGGTEAVYTHTPGSGPTRLVQLPGSLPGVGVDWSYSGDVNLPGVTDVAALPDGDVLLLTNTHEGPERGLRLARWDSTGHGWTLAPDIVSPGTLWQYGELCVGPSPDDGSCPDQAGFGCGPFACAVRPPEVRARPTAHIGEAYLVPRGSEVSLVYEAVETQRLKSTPYGGTEVQHVRVPLP